MHAGAAIFVVLDLETQEGGHDLVEGDGQVLLDLFDEPFLGLSGASKGNVVTPAQGDEPVTALGPELVVHAGVNDRGRHADESHYADPLGVIRLGS